MKRYLLIFYLCPWVAWGQLSLKQDMEQVWAGDKLAYLEDKEGMKTFGEARNATFRAMKMPLYSFGLSRSVFWLKLELDNQSKTPDWILLMDFAQHSYLDVYIPKKEGGWETILCGLKRPYAKRPLFYNFFAFPLSLPEGKSVCYIRVETDRACTFPVGVMRTKQFITHKAGYDTYYGIYIGIFLGLLVYNTLLWLGLRKLTYLYYSCTLSASLLMITSNSGHFYQYIVPESPMWGRGMIEGSSAVLAIFAPLFAQSFLGTRKYAGWVHHALSVCTILGGILLVALLFLPIVWVMHGLYNLLSIEILFLLASGIMAWRRKMRYAVYYVFAWIFYLVGGLCRMWADQAILPWMPLTHHGAEVGSALEVMLLSLALSSRYNAYRREKEEAIRHAFEVEKEAKETLELKVQERTHQLKESNEELNQTNEELQTTLEMVEIEKQKSDKLLLNILPEKVAMELKNYGIASPKRHEHVTVLFTDFKGFTQIVASMKPEQVLDNLNYCFTAFDKIIRKYHLEKIKTIGDAYMCAGGLPEPDEQNPENTVRAALEMLKFIEDWKEKKARQGKEVWDIRIGIHTGAVIAGVVGDYKFAYDIWGDDVNVAARMENSGQAGKINISETTYNLVKDKFVCTPRGALEAKNRGLMNMYFVERALSTDLPNQSTT